MLGVFLALILIAVLRNGMQLANVGGAAQDIVVGALLLGAILAGNVVRAVQGGGLPWPRAKRPREEEQEIEATQVPVSALPTNDSTRSIDA
jgi:hypothetical protein